MTNPNLRTDLSLSDLHPFIVELPCLARTTTPHHTDIAHIFTLGPITFVINKIGIEPFLLHSVLERPLASTNFAETQHVGLPHQDVNLNRLAHVGGLPIGIREFGACDTGKAKAHGSQ